MNDHVGLAQLQKIDSQIDELNFREKKLPERDRFLSLQDEVRKIDGLFKTVSVKLHDESTIQKRLDDELKTLSIKSEREQKRLYSGTIKNPKELSSVQQEVSHLKEQIDEKELALLEQIEVVDKMKADSDAIEARLKLRTGEMDTAKKDMDRVLSEIASACIEFQAEREPVYAGISEDARSLYNRVRTKYPLAVTVLEEGICRGCRVESPSTDSERIEQSANLERCPNCSRIIVKFK